MVAVQSVMSESEGKADMPGVGWSMRSMSSFWRLGGVRGGREGDAAWEVRIMGIWDGIGGI
jgi:hypothetical protein